MMISQAGRRKSSVDCMDEIDFLQRDLVSDKDLTQVLKDKDHVYHVAANPDVRVGADNTGYQLSKTYWQHTISWKRSER